MLISASAISQESILSKEIEFVKSEAEKQGFETIQEDTLLTSFSSHLELSSDAFEQGYMYYWVLFADSCVDCAVQLKYLKPTSSSSKSLEAIKKIRYDGGKGYFWINDTDAVIVMHPIKPQLNGSSSLFNNFVLPKAFNDKKSQAITRVSFIGRLSSEKGPDIFIQLASHFKNNNKL